MKIFDFTEAEPLIAFFEANKDNIIGHNLNRLDMQFWPEIGWPVNSDEPVVLELDNCFVEINYLVPSDIEIIVGTKEEISQNKDVADIINIRNLVVDYYAEEFERGVKKELIENCKITGIEIERFSEAFECNGATGEERPEGGDYFSTIRLQLDSGISLCFCGADSLFDGYIDVWCE